MSETAYVLLAAGIVIAAVLAGRTKTGRSWAQWIYVGAAVAVGVLVPGWWRSRGTPERAEPVKNDTGTSPVDIEERARLGEEAAREAVTPVEPVGTLEEFRAKARKDGVL